MYGPYREQVWVVIATAAPVIALALTVVFGDATGTLRSGGPRTDQPSDPRQLEWPFVFWLFTITIAVTDFMLMILVFAYALGSLPAGKNEYDPHRLINYTVIGLVGVALASIVNGFAHFARRSPGADTDTNEADPDDQAGRIRRRTVKRGLVSSPPVRRRRGRG